jgi:hypothetical protein
MAKWECRRSYRRRDADVRAPQLFAFLNCAQIRKCRVIFVQGSAPYIYKEKAIDRVSMHRHYFLLKCVIIGVRRKGVLRLYREKLIGIHSVVHVAEAIGFRIGQHSCFELQHSVVSS